MKNDIELEERKSESNYSLFSDGDNKKPILHDKFWLVQTNGSKVRLYESEVKKYVESHNQGKYVGGFITMAGELKITVEYLPIPPRQEVGCYEKLCYYIDVLIGKLTTNYSSYFLPNAVVKNLIEDHTVLSGHSTFDNEGEL